LFLYWAFTIPALLLALASLRAGWRHWQYVAASVRDHGGAWTPPATLIVPVKGLEEGLAANLRSLVQQDYPDFELLVVASDPDDPSLPHLRGFGRLLLSGPPAPDTGEKIHNLLAAVAAARPQSRVLAFADSDGRVESSWLRALVAALEDPAAGAATGYRWYFPEGAGFWSLLRSVWNSTIAGTFGAGHPRFAWGGAMAIRREIFEAARVAQFWRGAVSDDYRLTEAVRAAGLEVRFTPLAMVATGGECDAREFLSWARRQMIITRVYAPRLWWGGFAAHVFYCGAMVAGAAAIAAGRLWAVPMLAAMLAPGMLRGAWRRRAATLMFPARAPWLARHGWIYSWLTPLATWTWLYTFLASAWTRRIEWRGRVYELVGRPDARP